MNRIMSILVVAIFILSGLGVITGTSIYVKMDNQSPSAPIMSGPTKGIPGVEYFFSFNSSDPDGDNVSYIVDWKDGTNLEITEFYPSGEEITLNHTWSYEGAFEIMAGARDVHDLSSKPAYWLIGIGRSKNINQIHQNFHQILQIMLNQNPKQFQNMFPILTLLLQRIFT